MQILSPEECPARTASGAVDSRDALQLLIWPAERRSDALTHWRELELVLPEVPLACSAVWTETWLEHYGDLVPHRFAIAFRNGRIAAACLLTEGVRQKAGPIPLRTLHLGTAGEPDADSVCVEYNGLIVRERCRHEFIRSLLRHVECDRRWDEFRLDGFSAAEACELVDFLPRADVRTAQSRYADLKAARETGEDAISAIGYSTRKTLRKNLRAYGDLQTEWAGNLEQACSIFDDMVRLHQARWNEEGKPGSYASERFRAFHEALIRTLLPLGKVGLFRVTHAGEVIGCVELFIDRNRALCYQGGSAPYDGKRSPGLVVDYLCMEECLLRGFDAYDFLAGEMHHKQRLTNAANELVWVRSRRPRLKHFVIDVLKAGRQRVRRWREQPNADAEAADV